MQDNDKGTVKIVLALVGCLGCVGVLLLFAVFGFGFLASSTGPMTPITPPMMPIGPPPVAPPSPTLGVDFVTPSAPPGWAAYAHSAPCPANPNLRLTHFQAAYPATFNVMPCQEQEPRPWSYVTFHLEVDGVAEQQITLGFARGFPTQQILADVATQLVSQLGAPPPRLVDASPFVARGTSLLRRDSVFEMTTTTGVFAPGSYLLRQVVVLSAGPGTEGVMVTLVQRIRTTEAETVVQSNASLLHTVNSIEY